MLTNYHWNGGSDLRSRTLLHPSQLVRREETYLRELVFDLLSDSGTKLPRPCRSFLEPDEKKTTSRKTSRRNHDAPHGKSTPL